MASKAGHYRESEDNKVVNTTFGPPISKLMSCFYIKVPYGNWSMILSENLSVKNIRLRSEAKNRWDIIRELVSLAVRNGAIPEKNEDTVTQALIDREKSMSTGIGKGVAIPHCALPDIDNIIVLLGTHEKGLPFDAIDSLPVRIIIVLLVPKSKLSQHIKSLASIAKIMSDENFKEGLLTLETSEAVVEYIDQYKI
jgi:mannitol/fructose-specific phosphotransferase system IIA component (Ntr-type)